MKKTYCVICGENLKTLKYHAFSKKTLVLSIVCSKCKNEDKKKETNQLGN